MNIAPANREQRRLAKRMQAGKPAPRRQDRGAAINTLDMVRNKVGRLTDAEVAYIMKSPLAAMDAMRRGVASEFQWHCLAELVTMGVIIEASGIVTGLSEHFAAAKSALEAVRERVTAPARPTWGSSTAMRADELHAVTEAMDLHRFQLSQLSGGELQRLFRVLVQAQTARMREN